jgi:hypothetical protein
MLGYRWGVWKVEEEWTGQAKLVKILDNNY